MSLADADVPHGPVEEPVQTLIEEFVARLQAGTEPDRDEFILAHPSQAGALESRLEAAELLHHLAAGEKPAASPSADAQRPARIGRYRIDGTLGIGASAIVYQAYDPKFQRAVALKVIRWEQPAGSDLMRRCERDAQIAARLRHPNIVPLHDTGEYDGLRYLDMELIRGPTLEAALQQCDNDRPSPAESADLVYKLATALDYAHQAGIVHRDVKPTNILIDERGEPQLTDFGLARDGDGAATLTVPGQIIGTPAYMSPEQAAGRGHEADARSDVYSLGVVLFRLLTGRLPFADSGSIAALLAQIIDRAPPRPRDLEPGIPRDLETICLKALEKSPSDRFATARAFADELWRWRQEEPLTIRPPTRWERGRRWVRRHQAVARVLTAASALVIVLAIASGWTIFVQREKRFEARALAASAQDRERLESEKRAEIAAWNLVSVARQRVRTPTEGRRRETIVRLHEAAALRALVPDGAARERLDLSIRSIYATSLSVPELVVAESDAEFPEVFYASWPVTIHPGGESLVIGTPAGPVRWLRGQPLQIPPGLDARKPRPMLAYAPDGRHLAFAPAGGGLQLWNESVTRRVAELAPDNGPRFLALGFSLAASTISACRADGLMKTWSLHDYSVDSTSRIDTDRKQPLEAARFNADASQLAVGDRDGRVMLYRRGESKPYREFRSSRFAVTALAWSADNGLLAVGTSDGGVQMWHTDGRPSHQLRSFGTGPSVINFTPEGQWLLAGGRNSGMNLWDVGTGLPALTGGYLPWSMTPDGRHFAGSDNRRIAFAELRLPATVRDLSGHHTSVERLSWSGDSRCLASLDSRFEVRVWDVERGIAISSIEAPRGSYFVTNSAIALNDDGTLLGYASGGEEAVALLVDARTGQEQKRWALPAGFERLINAGDRFLLVREEQTRPDVSERQTVVREFGPGHSPAGPPRVIRAAVPGEEGFHTSGISPDGRYYWWAGPRRPAGNLRVEAREIATGRLLKVVRLPHSRERSVFDAYLTSDSRALSVQSEGGWMVHEITGDRAPVFAPPGRSILSADSSWEMLPTLSRDIPGVSALRIRSLPGGSDWLELINSDMSGMSGACFSPNGRYAAWGNASGSITIVDLPLLQRQVREFERSLPSAGD